eukprot:Blabericola_migrator_1__4930@NODE_2571_length_2588_cov_219_087664_g1609_i0_p1_GENE_NODE_2571_length_2588_cov_219_087664_g1609_i0NODE_2571_length_2588_cov_219_087664_g1609_i0_p1_ORF_typecomplete_len452_score51_10_NODE_2571_length_2588_cov_219_087664_g1609_i07952150
MQRWGLTIVIENDSRWTPSVWLQDDPDYLRVLKTRRTEVTIPRWGTKSPSRDVLREANEPQVVPLDINDFGLEVTEQARTEAVPYAQCLVKVGEELVPRLVLVALLMKEIIAEVSMEALPASIVFCVPKRWLHPRVETALHKAAEIIGIEDVFVLWSGLVYGISWMSTRRLLRPPSVRCLILNQYHWDEIFIRTPTKSTDGKWTGHTNRTEARVNYSNQRRPAATGTPDIDDSTETRLWDELANDINQDVIHLVAGFVPGALRRKIMLKNPKTCFLDASLHECALSVPGAFARREILLCRHADNNWITAPSSPNKFSYTFLASDGLFLDRQWFHFPGDDRLRLKLYSDGCVKSLTPVQAAVSDCNAYSLHVSVLPECYVILESLWQLTRKLRKQPIPGCLFPDLSGTHKRRRSSRSSDLALKKCADPQIPRRQAPCRRPYVEGPIKKLIPV